MKKSSLLKMKNLPATEEMLAVAREDVPVKVGSGWNTFYRCRYSGFVRSAVEGGILKVTLYDPDAMRLGGTLPVYEIFMEKEKQQFLTYDRTRNEWRTAKIDYLEWQAKGSNNVWISAVDDAQIRQYLASDEKSVYRAILKFQRAVRDAELERRHRKETDPWDAEISQTPPLPKDWERWVNKVGIQENYIFYDYRKGGARYGYCTYCEKEVALKQRPYWKMIQTRHPPMWIRWIRGRRKRIWQMCRRHRLRTSLLPKNLSKLFRTWNRRSSRRSMRRSTICRKVLSCPAHTLSSA